MSDNAVRVGICGLGTVASGVVELFTKHAGLINQRGGGPVQLVHIGARRDNPGIDTSAFRVSRDIFAVADDPEVDIVIELIGGTTVARDLVARALENGKHVVTANKALIAEHGNALIALADQHKRALMFEAAVAGGIPIIKVLRESLAGNAIHRVAGIINGTGNFILTEMAGAGRSFDDVLKEAQDLGYAEADPTFDVDGTDAAHKLVILASLAFGMPLMIDGPFMEGIDQVKPEDLAYAAELGYRIKHLGIASRQSDGIDLRVHPTLIPASKQIANVDGVLNSIMVSADGVGELVLVGPGAGALPTASSVFSDIMDLARVLNSGQAPAIAPLGIPAAQAETPALVSRDDVRTGWYLRLMAEDRPGVMADITRLLGEQGISIESLIQRAPAGHRAAPRAESNAAPAEVPVVLLTDTASGRQLDAAVAHIESLDAIHGLVTRLRVEEFEEA